MTLKLKRSRREMTMSKAPPTKQVRFGAPECFPTTTTTASDHGSEESQPQQPLLLLWYTRTEQRQQFQASRAAIPAWRDDQGYGVLLDQSYQHPHSKVQEYLHAFCAQEVTTTTDSSRHATTTTLRGLELSLGTAHAVERHQAKQKHRTAVLLAQQQQQTNVTSTTNSTTRWEQLAQCSREHSAPSKLFAMRMGRADARVASSSSREQHGGADRLADEIVREHRRRDDEQRRRREWHQQQRKQQQSPSQQQVHSSPTIKMTAPSHPTLSTSHNLLLQHPNKHSFSSLICLQAPSSPSSSSNNNKSHTTSVVLYSAAAHLLLQQQHHVMALPIQHVVYGRYSKMPGLLTN